MKNTFYKLSVNDKKYLTNDAVLLSFEIPDDLKLQYNFLPGQYLTIKAEINGKVIRRSYSICSSPSDNCISIVVKAIEKGIFSNFIKDNIRKNDTLEVALPQGNFVYNFSDHKNKNIFIVAGGSGITAVISIITEVLSKEDSTSISLLYSNKSREDTIFFERLEQLRSIFPERLKIIYVFSRIAMDNTPFGRIDNTFLDELFQHQINLFEVSEFYSCGPEGLIKRFHDFLESKGIPKEIMKHELFHSTVNDDLMVSNKNNFSEIKIEAILNGESYFVNADNSQNILDALLNNGVDAPYSCKKGNCSSCVGKVINGEIKMKPTDVLMDFEIEDGFFLSCQSVPVTQSIVISYDEY